MCVNVVDTVASVDANVPALQSVINLQAAAVNDALERDCARVDAAGVCVSASVRHTEADSPATRSSGVALTTGWRASEQLRLGGFIDSNHAQTTPDAARTRQRTPLFGLLGDWHLRRDGQGPGLHAAFSQASSDLTVSRAVDPRLPLFGSEPGSGRTKLSSLAASVVARWGVALPGGGLMSPYVGVRHARLDIDGYTERRVANVAVGEWVSYPLTYAGLDTRRTTALLGLKLDGRVAPTLRLSADVGLELEVDRRDATSRATGPSCCSTAPSRPAPRRRWTSATPCTPAAERPAPMPAWALPGTWTAGTA